jgi:hypothetical protein
MNSLDLTITPIRCRVGRSAVLLSQKGVRLDLATPSLDDINFIKFHILRYKLTNNS